jgi:hypothetical protein
MMDETGIACPAAGIEVGPSLARLSPWESLA